MVELNSVFRLVESDGVAMHSASGTKARDGITISLLVALKGSATSKKKQTIPKSTRFLIYLFSYDV